MGYFKSGISKEISRYATDEVFLESRYLFTRRQGKKQFSYCTHCKKEFDSTNLKLKHQANYVQPYCSHGMLPPPARVKCPHCGSECVPKASGIGRKSLLDRAYFIYFDKSTRDSNVVVARGFAAFRDYSNDYHDVKTQYLEVTRYVFEMGGSKMFSNAGYYWDHDFHNKKYPWQQRKTAFIDQRYSMVLGLNYSLENIKKAVSGTQFQYSCWEEYQQRYDIVEILNLYSRYPCIEYLTKFGFKELVREKLGHDRTYSAINWRGKTVFKVLKLNKNELKEIKQNGLNPDCFFLHLLQMAKKDGSNLTPIEINELSIREYHENYLKDMLAYLSFRKAFNYIQKQRACNPKRFKSGSDVLSAWNDYLRDCKRLNLDVQDLKVIFHKNLHAAHQNMIKQINIKADAELQVQIAEKAKLLKKLYYKHQGLLIRPAQTADELIAEGKALNHCVGNYAPDYAKGLKTILFVRKAEAPDTPYFTMELRGKTVIQLRGKNNCSPDEIVKQFVEAFKEAKLVDKRERERIRIPA
jgi:DNA-directed RNA polymerase subunit RPC12/RpoP